VPALLVERGLVEDNPEGDVVSVFLV